MQQAEKLDCPKFLVGETYGGFRAPKVARALQERENIGVNGLILLSPALDFGWIEGRNNPLLDAARLPSLAASHSEAKERSEVAGAESYASGEIWPICCAGRATWRRKSGSPARSRS